MARLIWNGDTTDSTKTPGNYIDESTGTAYGSAIATGDTIIFNYRSGDFDTDVAASDWSGIDLAGVEVGADYGGSIVNWAAQVSNGSGLFRIAGGQYIRILGNTAGIDVLRIDALRRGGSVVLGGTVSFPSIRVGAGGRCLVEAAVPVAAAVNAGGILTLGADEANLALTNEAGTTIVNGRSGTNTLALKGGIVRSCKGTPWSSVTQDGGHMADQSIGVITTYNANAGTYSPEGAEGNVSGNKITTLNEAVGRWRGLLKAGNIVVNVGTHNRL